MDSNPDGTDVGSFVSGYLDRNRTEDTMRDLVHEVLSDQEYITCENFESELPPRSHTHIKHGLETLIEEGFIEETQKDGGTVYVAGDSL